MLPNSWADEVLQKYPVGAQVHAYYDASQPGLAFLIPMYGGERDISVLNSICVAAMGIGVTIEQKINSNFPIRFGPTIAAGGVQQIGGFRGGPKLP